MTKYKIQIKTIHGAIITFTVQEYEILEGDLISFTDRKTNEKKIYHTSNCEITEVKE